MEEDPSRVGCMEEYNESSVRQKSTIKAERQAVQSDGEASDAVWNGGGDRDEKAGEQNGSGGSENAAILTGENKNR